MSEIWGEELLSIQNIVYDPFLDSDTGNAYINFEVPELSKFWTEKILEIDPTERKRPSLGL